MKSNIGVISLENLHCKELMNLKKYSFDINFDHSLVSNSYLTINVQCGVNYSNRALATTCICNHTRSVVGKSQPNVLLLIYDQTFDLKQVPHC